MRTKLVQLKDLKPGAKIKTFDNGEIVFRTVVDVWDTNVKTEDRLILEFTNGTRLKCSCNHPIMILTDNGIEQKLPKNLTEFDEIITDAGSCYLCSINIDTDDIKYIDIEVDGTNTFFASSSKHDKMVLTHNSQGGVRNGAATLYYPLWHLEIEDLLVLKNNKGTEDNRVRHMDYGVQFNKLMYERLITGGDITLFSPSDVPGLYDAFFSDQEKFRKLYEAAESNLQIRKKTVKAVELFSSFMTERKDTGRVYLMNVDNVNFHGAFLEDVAPIRQSNLCCEITLPTKPLTNIYDETGEISLCTLSAINWGNIKEPKDFERPCRLAVRALDELLDYQNYPVKAAQNSTINRRPLGVGIINLAYWLAKNDFKYSDDSALIKLDEYMEAMSYYLIKVSVDLAKEKGACPKSNETKYARGIMPVDSRKQDIDEIVPHVERCDWDQLREDAKTYGIRNSTLMAIMPAECQSLNNEIELASGFAVSLEHLIKEIGHIDIDVVHEKQMIGQRFAFDKPIELNGSKAYECYYNGPAAMTEIEFEDGNIYRFTKNHKLLINRNNIEQWIQICDLTEHDEVVSINAK